MLLDLVWVVCVCLWVVFCLGALCCWLCLPTRGFGLVGGLGDFACSWLCEVVCVAFVACDLFWIL